MLSEEHDRLMLRADMELNSAYLIHTPYPLFNRVEPIPFTFISIQSTQIHNPGKISQSKFRSRQGQLQSSASQILDPSSNPG